MFSTGFSRALYNSSANYVYTALIFIVFCWMPAEDALLQKLYYPCLERRAQTSRLVS